MIKDCKDCPGICCTDIEVKIKATDAEIAMLEKISNNEEFEYGNSFPDFHKGNDWLFPCVFYNEKEHECWIYNIRPQFCRDYVCPIIKNDGIVTEEEVKKINENKS